MGQATQLAVLSDVAVGMWSAKDQGMWFLIVPRRHLLVFIVESEPNSSKRRIPFGPTTTNLLRQLGAHSPFSSVVHRDGGCAFAFEVSFDNISGIDYSISLLMPGRLVLEAHKVRKREFESLESAFAYYGGADGEATRASLDALFGEASPVKQQPWETPMPSPTSSQEDSATSGSPGTASSEKTQLRRNTRGNLLSRLSGAVSKARAKEGGLFVRTKPAAAAAGAASLRSSDDILTPSQPRLEESTTPRMFPRSFYDKPSGPAQGQISMRLSHSTGDLLQMVVPVPTGIVYDFRLITVHWTDPQLPELLRPVIESNEKLLRMYESGLPAWATIFPRAGLYYKPWLRTLSWVLFYAFSLFSLAAGFYDLYKTLPGLQAVLSRAMGGLWLPPAAVLEWIEEHAQIRLSILLTYLFGKSEMLVYVVRMLGHVKRVLGETAAPVLDAVVPPIVTIVKTGIAPAVALIRTCFEFICTVLLPPLQALYSVVVLPVTWVAAGARHAVTVCQGMMVGGTAAASATPWLLRAMPADAFDALRVSLGRATRAAQSIWRTIVQMVAAFTRHRITLSRRMARWRRRTRERIVGAMWFIIDCLVVCVKWSWALVRLMVAAAKAGALRAAIEEGKKEISANTLADGTFSGEGILEEESSISIHGASEDKENLVVGHGMTKPMMTMTNGTPAVVAVMASSPSGASKQQQLRGEGKTSNNDDNNDYNKKDQ